MEENCDLNLKCDDIFHVKDSIFDLMHLDNGQLLIVLQSIKSSNQNKEALLHLAKTHICLKQKAVVIEKILKRNIQLRCKDENVGIIRTEHGPALISYPNNFAAQNPDCRFIRLLFAEKAFNDKNCQIQTLAIARRYLKNELWCDPFIWQGKVYFFSQFSEDLFAIPLHNTKQDGVADVQQIQTYSSYLGCTGEERRPPKSFVHRSTIIFTDFALVLFSQTYLSNPFGGETENNMSIWKLALKSMTWEPMIQNIHTHTPKDRVAWQLFNNRYAFMHGTCGRVSCVDKYHLFELCFDAESRQNSNQSLLTVTDMQPTHLQSANLDKSHVSANRPNSNFHQSKGSTTTEENMSLAESESNMLLSQQLKQAKEMGYSDAEILAALDISNGETNSKPFKSFGSTSEMIDALSLVQKLKEGRTMPTEIHRRHRQSPLANNLSASMNNLSSFVENSYSGDQGNSTTQRTTEEKFPPSWTSSAIHTSPTQVSRNSAHTSIALSSSTSNLAGLTKPNISNVNRSVSFNDSNITKHRIPGTSIGRTPSHCSALRRYLADQHLVNNNIIISQPKSSVQRLIDTFENENRRHFEEFQRINDELRKKLEANMLEEERLRTQLKDKESKILYLDEQVKDKTELEKMLENANRRGEHLSKELELREAELSKHIADLSQLRRHFETESRKADEIKNSLNAEIGRLIRENASAEELHRENTALRSELMLKEEQLQQIQCRQRLRLSSRDNEQRNGATSEGKDNKETGEVRELRELVRKLEDDNHELRQQNQPTCGVCMDNRREVIFMPCLHFTCCKSCADAMDNCSICRLRIMGKIEFFQ
ncbi:zinc finger, c3HC4 type (RING finger) domain-containing protein [Ditylenchus destructor]|uniref:Zinc finger, c3HC4 type (RING finger) domain-containing protein n=1 Tax=Ditylenchus destructor TaxID=166010 RepID=A0AAD4NC69_9BILA|nr:zinc finger, c3HC4 type (RING finger) domain-containing protein [Ditylenchus destructor]